MYRYEIVNIEVGKMTGKIKADIDRTIHDYAKQGWRLHSCVPINNGASGMTGEIKVIFEKEM
ncbi:DUF4177 domain-containing protein [Lysinibacillus sp. KU-BSD001]|uniref:DUF4177 domain-containing protein n=1 Tax=Lysinibacillus sp. KU-BSD001 TaxID=3141328 RepID=UPI0036E4AAC7